MHRFMIGLYGGFDEKKYERDFRDGFHGIEACLFETEADKVKLAEAAESRKFQIGIHFPFTKSGFRLRDALFLAQDEKVRQDAFDYIQEQLEGLGAIRPEYILFHYPKPVILDDRVGWGNWNFSDSREYVYESGYSFAEFVEKSESLFAWLHAKADEYHFTPVLEFDALNRYVYGTDCLESLLDRYPNIRLCLDTGRLYLQDRLDPSFDAGGIIRTYAKYAKIVHLWNVRVTDAHEYNHYPALPCCLPNEGWAPIEDYLRIIQAENPDVLVLFEHRSEWIDDEQLDACYRWVNHIMKESGA